MLNSWKSQVSRAFYARFGRQILVAIMATALVSTGHSTVPSAVAVEPFRMERTADNKPILRQGDKFRIKWGSQGHEVGTFCTVGYIDQERKLIFSAAHLCGEQESNIPSGRLVRSGHIGIHAQGHQSTHRRRFYSD
ncbi:hypothetical protein [Corynebacterium pseudotuberculosis]|uniref:hypothetical protein n=1 Tax=Corynebacterium pseudotuberculosis TaxID=1719 RepID=UPI000A9CB6C9|nr:hypothetical protein [Corynebacterium pseudotuberculosis]